MVLDKPDMKRYRSFASAEGSGADLWKNKKPR
jgi:hypothetical protein